MISTIFPYPPSSLNSIVDSGNFVSRVASKFLTVINVWNLIHDNNDINVEYLSSSVTKL